MPKLVIFAIAIVPLLTLAGLLTALFWPEIKAAFRHLGGASWRRLALVLVAFALVLAPGLAFAQAAIVTAAPDTAPMVSSYVFSGLATVITFAATWALKTWVGISLSNKAQDDLHRAAETGAKAVATQLGVGLKIDDAVAQVQAHIEASVPGALKRLKPSAAVIENLALSKLATNRLTAAAGL